MEEEMEKFFCSESFNRLSDFEKKRCENLRKNFAILKSTGIKPKIPEFMRIKPTSSSSKAPKKNGSNQKDKKLQNTNVKFVPEPKKDISKEPSKNESLETYKKIAKSKKKLVVKDKAALKNFTCAFLSITEVYSDGFDAFISARFGIKSESFSEEFEDASEPEIELKDKLRYPKRNIAKKSYEEEEISSEDEYLHCDSCGKDYKGDCPEHGPYDWTPNTKVSKNDPKYAQKTAPGFVSVGTSGLRKAGLGAWTEEALVPGRLFGPYEGTIVKNGKEAKESGYSWEIRKGGKPHHFIEAVDERKSNWMRFVNCAPCEERQNLVAIQYRKQLYYKVYKPVLPFTELLVWYGGSYAKELGIDITGMKRKAEEPKAIEYSLEEFEISTKPTSGFNRAKRATPGRHLCTECDYSTDRKSHLTMHLLTHSGERPHQCPECGKGFALKHVLVRHLLVHSGEKRHACGQCGKRFSDPSALRLHKKLHTGEKPHQCALCGKAFTLQFTLRQHLLVHTHQKPHRCTQCPQRFARKSSLSQHVASLHKKDQPHQCTQCNKRFSQKIHLKQHVISVHTKEYPHRCQLCDKGYIKPSDLKKHIEKVHTGV